jgi:general secretion pathway protein J
MTDSLLQPAGRVGAVRARHRLGAGFTLIEVLVAITIMALLAVLSWRGLDGMARAQAQTSTRSDEVLTLQAGLAQWKLDLDSLTTTAQVNSLDWDGRVLRMTRRNAQAGNDLQVVAWTRRSDTSGQWLRWQSAPLRTLPDWNEAWARASNWAQTGTPQDREAEVAIVPLDDWQIFYYRGGAWSNPLSSEGAQLAASAPPVPGAPPQPSGTQNVLPDGIRVVLFLPAGPAISGRLTLDWVQPTLAGGRS